jgi:hypothetical protein
MAAPAVAAVVQQAAEVIVKIMQLIETIRLLGEKVPGPEGQTVMRMQKGKE